ncbi:MAG: hypothetical protein E4H09_01390 [Spirochaetales bacterium]|nr:MAG: hypothetical protein E4H09_01390 [Spirochaetales bacterium]
MAEPYEKHENTLEVNIVPLAFEYGISDVLAVEVRPMVTLQFRQNAPVAISHVGATVTVPRYIDVPSMTNAGMAGITGEAVTYVYNLQDTSHSVTVAAEAGFSVMFSQAWFMDVTVQPGATFVWNAVGSLMPVTPHFGVFVIPAYRFPTR